MHLTNSLKGRKKKKAEISVALNLNEHALGIHVAWNQILFSPIGICCCFGTCYLSSLSLTFFFLISVMRIKEHIS
jgi:hypothetical protein